MSEIPIKAIRQSEHEDSKDENEEETALINTETINISVDSFFLDKNENEIKGDFPLIVQRYQNHGYQGRD